MRRPLVCAAVAMIVLVGLIAETCAEVVGPLLPERTLEVGIMQRKVRRAIDKEQGEPVVWERFDYPITLRYGITPNATVSMELSGDPNAIVYDEDVIQYTVGAGIEALVASPGDCQITTGIHYYRGLDVYRDPGYCDNDIQGIDWTLLGQYEFGIGRSQMVVWGGPTISYLIVEAQAPCPEGKFVTDNVVGGIVGATLPSRIGLVLQGSLVWVDEPEYRLNLAYRF